MSLSQTDGFPSVHVSRNLGWTDLRTALAAGWVDFKAMPIFGIFFALFYMLGGIALFFGTVSQGQLIWFIAAATGFPILAPFAAVGIYEVSRRRETGEPVNWPGVLGALRGKGNGQLFMMVTAVLLIFGFWVIIAFGIFAIFVGQSGIGDQSLDVLSSGRGVAMLAVGTLAGGLIAFVLFSVTVVSLPMLLDRDVDFVTAIVASVEVVRLNRGTMLLWAALIAVVLFLSMLPFFVGLLIALPVLGHATWHLYRRALSAD